MNSFLPTETMERARGVIMLGCTLCCLGVVGSRMHVGFSEKLSEQHMYYGTHELPKLLLCGIRYNSLVLCTLILLYSV